MNKYSLESGDIILFIKNRKNIWNYFSTYSHIGIIINLKNKLYILENNPSIILEPNKENIINTTLTELNYRLCNYDGKLFYMKLKSKYKSLVNNHLKNNIYKYLKIKFPKYKLIYLIYNIIRYIFNNKTPPKYLVCSEFIYYILYNIGLEKDYLFKKPSDIIKNKFYLFKGEITSIIEL